MLRIEPISALRDNYIWLLQADAEDLAVVVDPGDWRPVEAELQRRDARLGGILVTHHHPDHTAGIPKLAGPAGLPVYGPARETIPYRSHALADGDRVTVEILGAEFEVLDIPGHTAGHIALYCPRHQFVLTGDTLFSVGCGRLFEGNPRQMRDSLARLRALPDETRIYCGHEYTLKNIEFALAVEPDNADLLRRREEARAQRDHGEPTLPSTIGTEKKTNPFLRWDAPSVKSAAERHVGRELADEVEVFSAIRRLKDEF